MTFGKCYAVFCILFTTLSIGVLSCAFFGSPLYLLTGIPAGMGLVAALTEVLE